MIAELRLTQAGSLHVKKPARNQGLLQVAGLGAAQLAFQAEGAEGGAAESGGAAWRGGDLTWGTGLPPPTPGFLCSGPRRAQALRLERCIQTGNFGCQDCLRKVFRHAKGKTTGPQRGGLTSGTTGQDLARSLFHEADLGLGGHLRKPRTTEWAEMSGRARRPRYRPAQLLPIERAGAGQFLAPSEAAIRRLLGGGGSGRTLAAA